MGMFAVDRLIYLGQYYTRGDIQKATGIHWATQEAVLRGVKDLTPLQKSSLSSYYGKTVYSNLKNLGMPARMANIFRNYAPGSVIDIELEFSIIVNDLSIGATIGKISGDSDLSIEDDFDNLFSVMTEKIKEGISRTSKSYEEIKQDYAKR